MKTAYFILIVVAFLATVFLSGCNEDDSPINDQEDPIETQATEDAANIVSEAIGGDNGGINDQLTDLDQFLQDIVDPNMKGKNTSGFGTLDSDGNYQITFNEADTSWNIFVTRSYTNALLGINGNWKRGYQVWFKNEGTKRQYPRNLQGALVLDEVYCSFISDSCSGDYEDRIVKHHLKNLSGSWVGSINLADSTISVNTKETYLRAANDTLQFGKAERTSDHSLTSRLENVEFKLFDRAEPARIGARQRVNPLSGTVSGEYNAYTTFKLGEINDQRTVKRNYTVEYGTGETSGNATVTVQDQNGKTYQWEVNIQTGQIVSSN